MFTKNDLRLAVLAVLAACGVFLLTGVAAAAPPPPAAHATDTPAPAPSRALDPRFHADVEIDPTAYVLGGYSLHVGLGWRRVRVDLGAFAMTLPGAFVPGDDF